MLDSSSWIFWFYYVENHSKIIIIIFLKEGKDEGFLDGLGVLLEC
jgi:hypothetical protein